MRENKGFTLIELIVVITIMAVMAGVATLSVGLIFGNDSKKCINYIESTLSEYRIKAMSVSDVDGLRIYKNASDNCYYVKLPNEQEKKISSDKVTVKYYTSMRSEEEGVVITSSTPLTLQIDRSSGAYKSITGNLYCYGISVSKGSESMRINIVPETGKHYLE